MAIAVLVIREKDQARLLEKDQKDKESLESEAASDEALPSFKGSVDDEDQEDISTTSPENNSGQADPQVQTVPVTDVKITPAPSISATTAPSPSKKTKPSNAKTKTS